MKTLLYMLVLTSFVWISCSKTSSEKSDISRQNTGLGEITISVVDNEAQSTRTYIYPNGKRIHTKIPKAIDSSCGNLVQTGEYVKIESFEDPENLVPPLSDSTVSFNNL